MTAMRRWLDEIRSVPKSAETAVREAEFVVLDDHRSIRHRVSGVGVTTVIRIRSALDDAAAPRLTGGLGRALWQLGILLAIVASAFGFAALRGRRSIEADTLEGAAPDVLTGALVCLLLLVGQIWLVRRAHDRRSPVEYALVFLAVLLSIMGTLLVARALLERPDDPLPYLAVAAVVLAVAAAHLAGGAHARRVRRRLAEDDAPPRPRIAKPRSPAGRVDRVVSRAEKQVRALLSSLAQEERDRLRAQLQRALDELRRRGVLNDDELAAARSAELGMATIRMVADQARRGALEFEPVT